MSLSDWEFKNKEPNRFISGVEDQSGISTRFLTQDIYLDDNDVLMASPGFDITKNFSEVGNLLSNYNALYQIYHAKMRIYKGDHDAINKIKTKTLLTPDKSRIAINIDKNIVNTFSGCFASIPIKVTYVNPKDNQTNTDNINDYIQQVLSTSNSDDVFFEWAKKADIYGRSYAVSYINTKQQVKFATMGPENCLVVYDNTLDHNELFGLTFQNINGSWYGTLYTPNEIFKFSPSGGVNYTDNTSNIANTANTNLVNQLSDTNWQSTPNPFGEVPISELPENEERNGMIDDLAPIIDAFDETISLQHDDVAYFSNALLVIKGKKLTDQQKRDIKKWHVATLNSDDPQALQTMEMSYLDKPQNDNQQQHHLQNLKNEMYETSQVINLSDPDLGSTASGDALNKKLQPMVMLAMSKGRKMDAAIKNLLRILFTQTSIVSDDNIEDVIKNIQVTFTPNIPHDELNESNIVKNLNGIVSKPLQLAYLSKVTNIQNEINEEDKEKQQSLSQFSTAQPIDSESGDYPPNKSNAASSANGSDDNSNSSDGDE